MSAAAKITACRVWLLEAGDRVLAEGVVAIDVDGPPPVIFWEGDAFLPTVRVDGTQCYRKTRVMYAGASFGAVK